jgi:hypothetical protein
LFSRRRAKSAAAGASAFVPENRTYTDLVPAIAGLLPERK